MAIERTTQSACIGAATSNRRRNRFRVMTVRSTTS
jgi:hypothetical protein